MDSHLASLPCNEAQTTFRREGYLVLPQVVGRHAIDSMRNTIADGTSRVANRSGLPLRRVQYLASAWNGRCRFVQDLVQEFGSTLAEAAMLTTDINTTAVDASLFVKTSHSRGATHAHQDIAYKWNQAVERRYAVTTWLALDACGPTRGGLSFSSTFSSRRIVERQDFLSPEFEDQATTSRWASGTCSLELQPGDVVVFDARTWHASHPFHGEGQRRALAIRWASLDGWESTLEIPPPPTGANRFGMDTSGKLLTDAINTAFTSCPVKPGHGSALQALRWLSGRARDGHTTLPEAVKTGLDDLEAALVLSQEYHARPNADVWLKVRDVIIPALLSAGGPVKQGRTS